jgi:hypothetical protein
MTWTRRIYDTFGPDVQDRDIVAALWHYTEEELDAIIQLAATDIVAACRQFLAAREAADREFGPGWSVIETNYRDAKARNLEARGLRCERDGTVMYWIVSAPPQEGKKV